MLDPQDSSSEVKSRGTIFSLLLLTLVLCTFAIRATQIFHLNINWDEFHYLAHLYDYLRGTLTYPWASFHVHLFGWLPAVEGHEVDQILAARQVMLLLGVLTAGYIFLVARRFMSTQSAVFAVLCYQSLGYVMAHGGSFRPDPMAAFCFVFVVHQLLPSKRSRVMTAVVAGLAAVVMAMSLMLSIKALLHLAVVVTMAGVTLTSVRFQRREVERWAVFALTLSVTFGGLYVGHRATLSSGVGGAEPATHFLMVIASKLFRFDEWFPRLDYFEKSLLNDPLVWTLILGGGLLSILQLVRGDREGRLHALLLLIFASPLLSLAIYRNAFPYFYPFILPLAVLLCGVCFEFAMTQTQGVRAKVGAVLIAIMIAGVSWGPLSGLGPAPKDRIAGQRQHLDMLHYMFPEPVPYLDRCSMVSSFPQVGFFMSTWGMEKYRTGATRSLTASVHEDQPVFILANNQMLNLKHSRSKAKAFKRPLLEDDLDLLMESYIRHWGRIFVAGRKFEISDSETVFSFSMAIAGPYTLESDMPVWIDGVLTQPLEVVELELGSHSLRGSSEGLVTLRWGRLLFRSRERPLTSVLFDGFK